MSPVEIGTIRWRSVADGSMGETARGANDDHEPV